MWAALMAILHWSDQERREVKLGLTVVFFDIILLLATETIIVAISQKLLSPMVMCVGIAWILATALAIWFLGGVVVDSLTIAAIVRLKIGDSFLNAVLIFGMIHVWIVSFFMFIPVWQFWPGFAGIIIALMGWGLSAPLAGAKFNWQYVRKAYIAMVVAMAALIILVGAFKSVGKEISAETVRLVLQGGLGIWLMGAVLLLILGAIPKMPARKLLQWAGVATILAIVFITLAWPSAKKELMEMEKDSSSQQAQKELPVQKPSPQDAELACATVVVPAGKVINTQFLHRPRERIHFRRVAGGSSDPNVPPYYIHGDNDFNLPVYKENFSCEYPVSDTVRLKGGPVTTMVTISK